MNPGKFQFISVTRFHRLQNESIIKRMKQHNNKHIQTGQRKQSILHCKLIIFKDPSKLKCKNKKMEGSARAPLNYFIYKVKKLVDRSQSQNTKTLL